ERGHLGLLLRREAGHSAGPLAVAQGKLARFTGSGEPLAHRTVGDAEGFRDPAHLPALLEERPGAEAATFTPSGRFFCRFARHRSLLPNPSERYTLSHGSEMPAQEAASACRSSAARSEFILVCCLLILQGGSSRATVERFQPHRAPCSSRHPFCACRLLV